MLAQAVLSRPTQFHSAFLGDPVQDQPSQPCLGNKAAYCALLQQMLGKIARRRTKSRPSLSASTGVSRELVGKRFSSASFSDAVS